MDRLRSLLPEALDVIKEELKGEDRLKVALSLVKIAGVTLDKIGIQDADAIVENEAKGRTLEMLSTLGSTVDREKLRKSCSQKPLTLLNEAMGAKGQEKASRGKLSYAAAG